MSGVQPPSGNLAMKAGFAALCLIILLAAANYLAGAILFMTFFDSPGKADFFTIEHAIAAQPNAQTMKKIKFSGGLALLLCLGVPLALVLTTRRKKPDLFGNARFANLKDIQQEKLDANKGVVIGKFKDSFLRLGGYEFVLLAAPTRTGKGVGFCIPNLLQFQESVVVLDIKGENYNLSSEFRRRYMGNEIFYFNPFSETTHRWNPLSYISTNPNFRTNDLMALAAIIYPANEKDPFWSDSARNLFVGLGLLVLETPELPQTIGEILRQGSGKGYPVDNYLKHVLAVRAASERPLSNACRESLGRFLDNAETTLKSIVGSFSAPLAVFGNPVIDKATSGDDFDLRDVRKKKMSVYLHIPAGEILQASFIVNLFFSQLINENVKELPEQNPALKYQCLLLLDEFTAMGKVAIIAKGVGYMAGYNMRLAIIIQDKTQLEAVYGKEDAHNIVSNMGAVIYFTPSQVSEAEEYSKMIGNIGVKSTSKQLSKGGLLGGGKGEGGGSETESLQSRALMLPQELLTMSKDQQLVVRSGIPVIQAGKIRYFSDPYFSERFNAVPMQEVTIGSERRKVPVPVKLPSGDWPVWHAALEKSDYYVHQTVPVADAGAAESATATAAATAATAATTAATTATAAATTATAAAATATAGAKTGTKTAAAAPRAEAQSRAVATAPAATNITADATDDRDSRDQNLLDDGSAKAANPAAGTTSSTAAGAAASAAEPWPLPDLPAGFEAWGSLHARLSAPLPMAMPPATRVAKAYADSIVRYWQLAKFADSLSEATLMILDLNGGNAVFPWQMLCCLQERLATLPFKLPPFHYIACCDNEDQLALLDGHPYFKRDNEGYRFSAVLRATALAKPQNISGGNPVVVIAHELFGSLEQQLLAIHYGTILQAEAKVIAPPAGTGSAIDVTLAYEWPALTTDSLNPGASAVMEMYKSCINSAPVMLPGAALDAIDTLSELAGGRFLLLSLDAAVVDERAIRLGIFSAPAVLPLPAPPQVMNYHALAFHLRSGGAKVWQEKAAGSDLAFGVALRDDQDPAMLAALPDLLTPLASVHSGEPAVAPAGGMTLANCLALLQQAHYDPALFDQLFDSLQHASWQLPTTALEQWQQALRRVWQLVLPLPDGQLFYRKVAWLAMQVNYFGLAREATATGLALQDDNADDLYLLAVCEAETGNPAGALRHLRAALALEPAADACRQLLQQVESRLQQQQARSWFRTAIAKNGPLRLEPLDLHHAQDMFFQYRDRQISAMTSLPPLNTLDDARNWITTQAANPDRISCAVLHEARGFVGVVSLQHALDAGYFHFWIGADYQGRGFGVAAANILLAMAAESGIRQIYTSSFGDNLRSRRALAAIGFSQIDTTALAPNDALLFFHLGSLTGEEAVSNGLAALCRAIDSQFHFAARQAEAAQEV